MSIRRKRECKLLPHVLKPVYGLDPNVGQFILEHWVDIDKA